MDIGKDDTSQYFICTICQDYFKEPTTIGCGHTFCSVCIRECRKSQESRNFNVKCPVCRVDSFLQGGKNVAMQGLMERIVPHIVAKRREKRSRKEKLLSFQKAYFQSERRLTILKCLYRMEQYLMKRQTLCISPIIHVSELFEEISTSIPNLCLHEEEFFACLYEVLKFGWPSFIFTEEETKSETIIEKPASTHPASDHSDTTSQQSEKQESSKNSPGNDDPDTPPSEQCRERMIYCAKLMQKGLVTNLGVAGHFNHNEIQMILQSNGPLPITRHTNSRNDADHYIPHIIMVDGWVGCPIGDVNEKFVAEWVPNKDNYTSDLINVIGLSLISANENMRPMYSGMLNKLLVQTIEQLELFEKYKNENAHITYNVMDHLDQRGLSLVSVSERIKEALDHTQAPIYGKGFPLLYQSTPHRNAWDGSSGSYWDS